MKIEFLVYRLSDHFCVVRGTIEGYSNMLQFSAALANQFPLELHAIEFSVVEIQEVRRRVSWTEVEELYRKFRGTL